MRVYHKTLTFVNTLALKLKNAIYFKNTEKKENTIPFNEYLFIMKYDLAEVRI